MQIRKTVIQRCSVYNSYIFQAQWFLEFSWFSFCSNFPLTNTLVYIDQGISRVGNFEQNETDQIEGENKV